MDQQKKPPEASGQPNEGEGNRTATRRYNEAQQRFVRKGKVEEKAHEAADALDSPERGSLERAEAEGKSHIAEADPEVKR